MRRWGPSACATRAGLTGGAKHTAGFAGILLLVDGIEQTGGVAMTVLGFVRPNRVLRYEPARAGVRWAMTPGAAGAPLGLTLSLTNL